MITNLLDKYDFYINHIFGFLLTTLFMFYILTIISTDLELDADDIKKGDSQ